MGGAVAAVESGYMKSAMVGAARRCGAAGSSPARRSWSASTGSRRTEPSPLTADLGSAIQGLDPDVEAPRVEAVVRWRAERDRTGAAEVAASLRQLRADAASGANLMARDAASARGPASTTGEWAGSAARGVRGVPRPDGGVPPSVSADAGGDVDLAAVRDRGPPDERGARARRLRLLVGKPGLDGHSNGAEQMAVRARDAGFEVVYQGIRLTPAEIVAAAVAEDVHCVGLSILSGSHLSLVPDVLDGLRAAGAADVPVVVGGIIPEADAAVLRRLGVAAVFTPKDFAITDIMGAFVHVIRAAHGLDAVTQAAAPASG